MANTKRAQANPALRLALIRKIHVYIAVFVAPTMMFFALTGALQTFRIADRPDASDLLVKLTHVHRDDEFMKPAPRKPLPTSADKPVAPKPPPEPHNPPPKSKTALQWFFSLVSISFIVSTLLGLWMALAYNKDKAILWGLLTAGTAIPLLILAVL